MMKCVLGWLLIGMPIAFLACAVWRLAFRDPLTLGGIMAFCLGVVVWPFTLLAALTWFVAWAFVVPSERVPNAVPWPEWWWRVRYRQHVAWRRIWYLGKPPLKEDYEWRAYAARTSPHDWRWTTTR